MVATKFRALLGRWAEQPDRITWMQLFNGSLVHPLGYLHPAAWSPLCAVSRRYLAHPRVASAVAAQHLWADLEQRRGGMVAPLEYALGQPPLWQLVMCMTRRELLALALWCGASLARRQIASAVDRASAARWRFRLGDALYVDVLGSATALGQCRPMPPAQELTCGRLLLDVGLSMLAAWSADPEGWSRRRIETAAGPHSKPAEHYVGPNALVPTDASSAEGAVLSFIGRQCHAR